MIRIYTRLLMLLIGTALVAGCSKKEKLIANPIAVEVYKVSITDYPPNNPSGGTWDTEVPFSDPFGRPDLKVVITDNTFQAVGSSGGYSRVNTSYSNRPINFDIDTSQTVYLDTSLILNVFDSDVFDADDYMGTLSSDSLALHKENQPKYLTLTSGKLQAKVYMKWK